MTDLTATPVTAPATKRTACHNTGSWVKDSNGVSHHVNLGGDDICTTTG